MRYFLVPIVVIPTILFLLSMGYLFTGKLQRRVGTGATIGFFLLLVLLCCIFPRLIAVIVVALIVFPLIFMEQQ